MPAYWIPLKDVPNSPVGLGVTASDYQHAIQQLQDVEIDWHLKLSSINFLTINSIDEIESSAIRSAIQRPITEEGVWFPVFDAESIMQGCVENTARLRFSDEYFEFRNQLNSRSIDPATAILYSIDAGMDNDDTAYTIYFPAKNSATIYAKWDTAKRQPLWFRDIYVDDSESDTWDAENVVLCQMCSGKLNSQFNAMVNAHKVLQNDT